MVVLALNACGGVTHEDTLIGNRDAAGGAGSIGGGGGGGAGAKTFVPHAPTSHRPVADACARDRGPSTLLSVPRLPDGGLLRPLPDECAGDRECTNGINGRCIPPGRTSFTSCSYDACFTDGDCSGGSQGGGVSACVCAAALDERKGHVCAVGNCRTDSDCGTDGYCSLNLTYQPCNVVMVDGFYCHTSADTCADDTDCSPYDYCTYQKDAARWECQAVALCSG